MELTEQDLKNIIKYLYAYGQSLEPFRQVVESHSVINEVNRLIKKLTKYCT